MLIEKHKSEIDAILAKYPPERKRSAVIPILHIAQREYGYCPPEAMKEVAGIVGLDPTEVQSVVGFYTLFFAHKVGRHYVHVCTDLPCALRGADRFLREVCARLNLDEHKVAHGGDTTPDGAFSVEATTCLAACDKAPVAQIDLEYAENLTPETFEALIESLRAGQPYAYTPTGDTLAG